MNCWVFDWVYLVLCLVIYETVGVPRKPALRFPRQIPNPELFQGRIIIGSTAFTEPISNSKCAQEVASSDTAFPGSMYRNCTMAPKTTPPAPGMPYFITHNVQVMIRVNEGGNAHFKCRVADLGDYPVVWYKNNKGIRSLIAFGPSIVDQSRHYIKDGDFFNSTFDLRLRKVRRSDEDIYACSIQTTPPTELNFTLLVSYPASVRRILPSEAPYWSPAEPNRVYFNESSNGTLTCLVDGSPAPIVTWWKKDRPSRMTKANHLIIAASDNITLLNISREQSGQYVCDAENGVSGRDPPDSRVIDVVVQYAPEVQTLSPDIRVGEGKYLLLQCNVKAVPKARFYWMKDNKNLTLTSQSSDNRLVIISLDPRRDYGNYTCVAYNRLGSSNTTIQVSGRPLAPHVTSSFHGTRRHIYTLRWTPGANLQEALQDTIEIEAYDIYYRKTWIEDVNGRSSVRFYPEQPLADTVYPRPDAWSAQQTFILRDLSDDSTYEGQICPRNMYGTGDCADFKFRTRLEDIVTTLPPEARQTMQDTGGNSGLWTAKSDQWRSSAHVIAPSLFVALSASFISSHLCSH
ncbi:MAM domain-containing glycosylphosphatidylinositol anchor protein 2-like isoform X2 [Lytechinus variegatus]|uniref:MAM domain-containing glycosylphosphatidylinositol anchor protein 2-like isoform X2 n=1 Tax=Lytechinus variegatus TaxID=7654 RepID=UPI001BB1F395|nr:MAM domain-containing glycosylphosphatidylinositol anchor protein 2-like isoform X2 [Lytechinus variegatus]